MGEHTPDVIYLQWDNEGPMSQRNTTWSVDKINEKDGTYLLATPERLAAPDLLAACKGLVEMCAAGDGTYPEHEPPEMNDARAAINRASPADKQ